VIKNVVHVTVSGVFSSWYFLYHSAMPPGPTLSSLKRALLNSFGSICLGSLVIAVIKAFRAMMDYGRNTNNVCRCIVECLLQYLDALIQYFNVYAFTYVAMYGRTYCEAAKDTWNLIKARGFDLLINDNLIDGVMLWGCLFVGAFTGAVGVLLAKVAFNVEYWGVWALFGFLIGMTIAICTMEVVESTVATCFVCYAEDPQALNTTKPDEYNRLTNALNLRLSQLRGPGANYRQ